MGTNIRPEISKSNANYISRHRYYELKHFCAQYHEWKDAYNNMTSYLPSGIRHLDKNKVYVDHINERRMALYNYIDLVETCAKEASDIIGDYILIAVTEGKSYDYLRTTLRIPVGKDIYYVAYRKFFWLLDKRREKWKI